MLYNKCCHIQARKAFDKHCFLFAFDKQIHKFRFSFKVDKQSFLILMLVRLASVVKEGDEERRRGGEERKGEGWGTHRKTKNHSQKVRELNNYCSGL